LAQAGTLHSLNSKKLLVQIKRLSMGTSISHGSREMPTPTRLEQSTKASGKEASEMGLEPRGGLMELAIQESGKTIKHTAKASSRMLMETLTKDSGRMIKLMDLGSTLTSMEPCTKASGRTTCSTASELKLGWTVQSTKETTATAGSMDLEPTNGMMAQDTKASGLKTRSLV
jgi:hypothetical protein